MMSFDDNCVAVISNSDKMTKIREVESVNMHIRIGNTETKALEDSGSICTIINRSLENSVVLNSQENFWVLSPENQDLKIFSNEIIKTICVINTSVKSDDWAAVNVNVTVVEDGQRQIIGRYLFPQLRRLLTRTKQVSKVDHNQCLIKKQIAFVFPCLISRTDADTVPVEDYLVDNGWVTGGTERHSSRRGNVQKHRWMQSDAIMGTKIYQYRSLSSTRN